MNNYCQDHIDRKILFFCFDTNCVINKKLCILCLKHDHQKCNQSSIIEINKIEEKIKSLNNENINDLLQKTRKITEYKNETIKKANLEIKKALNFSMKQLFFKEDKKENNYSEKKIKLIKKMFGVSYDKKSEKIKINFNLEDKLNSLKSSKEIQKKFFEKIINSIHEKKFSGNILNTYQLTSLKKNTKFEQINSEIIKIITKKNDEVVLNDELKKNRLYKIVGKYKSKNIDEKLFGIGIIDEENYFQEIEKEDLKNPGFNFVDGIDIFQKKNFVGDLVYKFLQDDFEIFFFIDFEKKEFRIYDEGRKNVNLKLSKSDFEKKMVYFRLKNIEIELERVLKY